MKLYNNKILYLKIFKNKSIFLKTEYIYVLRNCVKHILVNEDLLEKEYVHGQSRQYIRKVQL